MIHEILLFVFVTLTLPVTMMLLARAALFRDRAEAFDETLDANVLAAAQEEAAALAAARQEAESVAKAEESAREDEDAAYGRD